jgi:hypothetical protein
LFKPRNDESIDFLSPLIFSGAAGFAFFILLILLQKSGNLKNFGSFWSLVVLGLFGGVVFWYFLFWTAINIFEGILIGLVIVSGLSFSLSQYFKSSHIDFRVKPKEE